MKVAAGSSFGIENQSSCGYDRLHIRSADNKGYGRLCSSAADATIPYNGMAKYETDGGTKIKSSAFREWLLLDTNHLVIAFDADKQNTGNGFSLEYQIIGDQLKDRDKNSKLQFLTNFNVETFNFWKEIADNFNV